MDLGSRGRKLSFEILSSGDAFPDGEIEFSRLSRSTSDPFPPDSSSGTRAGRRKRRHKKKKNSSAATTPTTTTSSSSTPMNPIAENETLFSESTSCSTREMGDLGLHCHSYVAQSGYGAGVVFEEVTVSTVGQISGGELRQRTVNGGGSYGVEFSSQDGSSTISVSLPSSRVGERENGKEEVQGSYVAKPRNEVNGKLDTAKSLDWKQLMADDPTFPLPAETSPLRYFKDEMARGNSLSSTTTPGNEKEREKVYDTIFRLPWRCELLIDVGFFVCLNSFLSLFTVMPARIWLMGRRLMNTRQFRKLSAAELSDFSSLVVLICGVALLGQIDISLIYHMIRGQGTIKLYVVYNVLEIFDKLWQSFGGDILETLFNTADRFVHAPPESSNYWTERYIVDLVVTVASSIVHSSILLVQAITLSTCIVAHNNALLALLVSNNFAEIKSNVFKRFSRDNVHSIVYADSVERFHISAFLLFVLAQNILEAEGSWFKSFLHNALLVFFSEMAIDIIKHSFIAKFNDIKPIVYSEFLEELCKQTLNRQTEGGKKTLTFVPLAPACVVIRVLSPVYAARLPCGSFLWRLFWIAFLIILTYVMLVSLKVLIGMGLQQHAAWYIRRCERRKLHSD